MLYSGVGSTSVYMGQRCGPPRESAPGRLRCAVGWQAAGKQEDTPSAIKRQRLCLDEWFAHKCCQAGGPTHDIMYLVRMCKV